MMNVDTNVDSLSKLLLQEELVAGDARSQSNGHQAKKLAPFRQVSPKSRSRSSPNADFIEPLVTGSLEMSPATVPAVVEDDDDDECDETPTAVKKGRRRINIAPIAEKSKRQVTFSKRKTGLFKKGELARKQRLFFSLHVVVFFLSLAKRRDTFVFSSAHQNFIDSQLRSNDDLVFCDSYRARKRHC
jgi:hypothetical protein